MASESRGGEMYSNAVTKVLNRLVDTSRVETSVDRSKLLSNIKLMLSITAYLDKELLWEAGHLAAKELVRQFNTVLTEMVALRAYVALEAPTLTPKTPVNPIPQTVQAQSTYYAALGELITQYRPRTTSQLDPETSVKNLRRALLSCFRSIRVLAVTPKTRLDLFTETFALRIQEWVDTILTNTNEVEIVEELGVLRALVNGAGAYVEPVTQKYSGVISVTEDTPATIDIQDGPYIFESAASVDYKLVAGGGTIAWSIPASIAASTTGGSGPWTIIPGAEDLVLRPNNRATTLSLTPGVYANAAALAAEINAQLTANGYTEVLATGASGAIVVYLSQAAAAEGMQLKVEEVGTTFPDHGFPYGWVRGEHSPLVDGPTINLLSDETVFEGDATLNVDTTVTVANADTILVTDLVRLSYQATGAPLDATYGIASIGGVLPDQILTLSSAAQLGGANFLGVPLTNPAAPETVTVEILRRNKILTNDGYLWIDTCVPLGLPAPVEDYASGANIVISGTPTPPLRRGDQVTISTVDYTLQSLSPNRLSAQVDVNQTSAVISSGMGVFYGSLVLDPALLKRVNPQKVQDAVDRFSNHMVFATWENLSKEFSGVYDALQALVTTLTGVDYPMHRLPRLAALLEKQGFTAAGAALHRGDIASFLAMSPSSAARGTDMAQSVRTLLRTYGDSGQTSL